jgi:hypothetical protein
MLTEGGEAELLLRNTVLESWNCDATDCTIEADGITTIQAWDAEGASIKCSGRGLTISQLKLRGSDAECNASQGESEVGEAHLDASRLRISGEISLESLEAMDSVIAYDSDRDIEGRWRLKRSVLAFSHDAIEQSTLGVGLGTDRGSIILAPTGLAHSLLTTQAGVFGSLNASSGKRPIRFQPDAWGVVEADEILDRIGLPATAPGCKIERLLLTRKGWYEAQILRPQRRRRVVADLHSLVEDPAIDLSDEKTIEKIASLRRAARGRYDTLTRLRWPDFKDFVDESSQPLLA